MKNAIIRLVMFAVVLSFVVLAFTGCSNKGTCYECGQEEKVSKYVVQGKCGNSGDTGEVIKLCDDCRAYYKMIGF